MAIPEEADERLSSLPGHTGDRRSKSDRRNLLPTPLPAVSSDDWQAPEATLAQLYRHAETEAIEAITWYLKDKKNRKLISQALRAVAIVLTAAGGLVPLITAAAQHGHWAAWGYVLLAGAASCIGFDRFFGLSAAWMRDVSAAQLIRTRLNHFQYDWATICASPPSDAIIASLSLISMFIDDINTMIHEETTEWSVEFQSRLSHLEVNADTSPRSAERRS